MVNITNEEVLGHEIDLEDNCNPNDDDHIIEADDDNHEMSSDESCEDPPDIEIRKSCAAFLLRIKETHNLPQLALDEIIQSTTALVDDAVKSVCVNVANQLQEKACHATNDATWQALYEENSRAANPFKDLETENNQKQAYKDFFGLVVSISWISHTHLV